MKIATNHQDTAVKLHSACLRTVSDTRGCNGAELNHSRTPHIRTQFSGSVRPCG